MAVGGDGLLLQEDRSSGRGSAERERVSRVYIFLTLPHGLLLLDNKHHITTLGTIKGVLLKQEILGEIILRRICMRSEWKMS